MSFIADGHIHLYRNFNLVELIMSARKNLAKIDRSDSFVLFTVEPPHEFEFSRISERINLKITKTENPNVVRIENLYLVAGRQIVTKERLEFLVLFCKEDIPNHLSISELTSVVNRYSGVLVLNWAPGKWMFKRAKIVKKILEDFSPSQILICDTALRFYDCQLLKLAKEKGFKIIAGSDPFPFKGEERRAGNYGFKSNGDLDFKEALFKQELEIVGSRLSALEVFKLLIMLYLKKKFKKKK